VLALIASFAAWFSLQETAARGLSADMQALIFLAVTIPAIVAMGLALFAPGWTERLAIRARRRGVVPSPA
jgi:hypothetical protein